MSKPCHFFFQNKNETKIFTINKPNIMKKINNNSNNLNNNLNINNIFVVLLFAY